MLQTFCFDVVDGIDGLRRPTLRYGILHRLAECARRQGITIVAFGVHDTQVRLILQGDTDACVLAIRGIKVGTHRQACSFGAGLVWGDTTRADLAAEDLTAAITWCHLLEDLADPLSSPWTSHRDLMGLRQADYFDASLARRLVNPDEVHQRCGGKALPQAPAPVRAAKLRPLGLLMRIAASVRGVLPAHRACFRLFVHLAVRDGWGHGPIAAALMLSRRRIRQLAQVKEPMVAAAVHHLHDRRLTLAA
jgi:hypothetical protein